MPLNDAHLSAEANPLHVWSNLRMELFWIYDGRVHPVNQKRETDHSHGYWIWFMQRGIVTVRRGNSKLKARAGECMVSPRGLIRQNFSPGAHILSLHFGCEWPTGDSLFADQAGCVFRSSRHPAFLAKARELSDFVKLYFPMEADVRFAEELICYDVFLQLQRHYTEWLRIFAQTMVKQGFTLSQVRALDARLSRAVHCLREASFDSLFPAAFIQQATGLGPSQLDRLFSQTFGQTTRSYWAARKLAAAKSLLATTARPIKEIGFRLGFKQASHFTAWFTDRADATPLKYRLRESSRTVQRKAS